MIFQRFSDLAVILLMITTMTILTNGNWRRNLFAFALQYFAMFWLVAIALPLGLAAVKLIVGWMVIAVIGASQSEDAFEDDGLSSRSGLVFRILAAAMVGLVVYSIVPAVNERFPTYPQVILGSLVLVAMGILQMGVTNKPLRVIVGLMTVLSGFEVIYASVEPSILVAGLLAVINIGLAMTGVYGLLNPVPPEQTS
ncbi:MAG: hypothetical protein HPY76_14285 [Anaerolineae bacterium]|nr:hypothetical protein [Anaerolineae bacterium]